MKSFSTKQLERMYFKADKNSEHALKVLNILKERLSSMPCNKSKIERGLILELRPVREHTREDAVVSEHLKGFWVKESEQ